MCGRVMEWLVCTLSGGIDMKGRASSCLPLYGLSTPTFPIRHDLLPGPSAAKDTHPPPPLCLLLLPPTPTPTVSSSADSSCSRHGDRRVHDAGGRPTHPSCRCSGAAVAVVVAAAAADLQ